MSGTPGAQRARRDLTVDTIVDRAAEIMRSEGSAALSMRRVAEACDVTPMAIYHHLAGKDDLVLRVVDHIVGGAIDAGPDEVDARSWMDAMIEFSRAFRDLLVENPGAGEEFIGRPIVGPQMARVTERFFEILAAGGITGAPAAEAVDAVVLVIMGSVANDLSRPPDVRERLLDQVPAEETPFLVAAIDAYAHRDPAARFETALTWLLEGIARRAGTHGGGP